MATLKTTTGLVILGCLFGYLVADVIGRSEGGGGGQPAPMPSGPAHSMANRVAIESEGSKVHEVRVRWVGSDSQHDLLGVTAQLVREGQGHETTAGDSRLFPRDQRGDLRVKTGDYTIVVERDEVETARIPVKVSSPVVVDLDIPRGRPNSLVYVEAESDLGDPVGGLEFFLLLQTRLGGENVYDYEKLQCVQIGDGSYVMNISSWDPPMPGTNRRIVCRHWQHASVEVSLLGSAPYYCKAVFVASQLVALSVRGSLEKSTLGAVVLIWRSLSGSSMEWEQKSLDLASTTSLALRIGSYEFSLGMDSHPVPLSTPMVRSIQRGINYVALENLPQFMVKGRLEPKLAGQRKALALRPRLGTSATAVRVRWDGSFGLHGLPRGEYVVSTEGGREGAVIEVVQDMEFEFVPKQFNALRLVSLGQEVHSCLRQGDLVLRVDGVPVLEFETIELASSALSRALAMLVVRGETLIEIVANGEVWLGDAVIEFDMER